MSLGRGLDFVIQDLDTRQRQGPADKNRPLMKFAGVSDTIFATPDAVTVVTFTPPYQWSPAATTSQDLIFNRSEWT